VPPCTISLRAFTVSLQEYAMFRSLPIACLTVSFLIGESATFLLADARKSQVQTSHSTARANQEELQGVWEVNELIRGDTAAKILPNEDVKGTVTFEQDRFRFTLVPVGKAEEPRIAATFILDPSRQPAEIDLTFTEGPDKGKTARGIYQLNDDELKLRIPSGAPFEARPEHFKQVEGSKTMLFTLKRTKHADPRPTVEPWLREEYRLTPKSRIRSRHPD
jgi:uncharacterized protein (TIGR03067 family)